MEPPVPDTGAQGQAPVPQTPNGALAEAARQVLSQAVAPSAQGQAERERPDPIRPLKGRHAVEWGPGALREVDIDELVKESRERETLQVLRDAQRAELQSLGTAHAIQQGVDRMTERQRAALAAAIQNPDLLDRLHGQAQPAPQDPVFPNDLAQPETPAPQRGGREDEMSQMRQAIAFLLQDAQERQNEKRATTKDRELEVEVGRWPWLQKDPGAHAYVLERTREAMALNPTADVRSVVNKHVAALQALLNRAPMPAPQPGREQVELVPARQPLANGYAATGKDLARGSSLRGAAAFVDRFERMRR